MAACKARLIAILCICLTCVVGMVLIAASADQSIAETMLEKKACSKTWCLLHGYTEDICQCGVCGSYGRCSWTCHPNATEFKEYALLSCKTKSNTWHDVADASCFFVLVLFLMAVIFPMWQHGSCGSKAKVADKTCTSKVVDEESPGDDASTARSCLRAWQRCQFPCLLQKSEVVPNALQKCWLFQRPEAAAVLRAGQRYLLLQWPASILRLQQVCRLFRKARSTPQSTAGLSAVSKPQSSLFRSSSESLTGVSPSEVGSCSEMLMGVSPVSKARNVSEHAASSPASSSTSPRSLVSVVTNARESILLAYQEPWDKSKLRIGFLKEDLQRKVDVHSPRSATEDVKRMLPTSPTRFSRGVSAEQTRNPLQQHQVCHSNGFLGFNQTAHSDGAAPKEFESQSPQVFDDESQSSNLHRFNQRTCIDESSQQLTSDLRFVKGLCAKEAHLRAGSKLDSCINGTQPSGGNAVSLQELVEKDVSLQHLKLKCTSLKQLCSMLDSQNSSHQDWGRLNSRSSDKLTGYDLFARFTNGKFQYWAKLRFTKAMLLTLSMFLEIDLYPTWVPYLEKAKILHVIEEEEGSRLQFITHLSLNLPWPIGQKETIVFGFGCEALERNQLFIVAKSVPAETTEFWGYDIPMIDPGSYLDLGVQVVIHASQPSVDPPELDILIESLSPFTLPKFLNATILGFGRPLIDGMLNHLQQTDDATYQDRIDADERGFYALLQKAFNEQGFATQ